MLQGLLTMKEVAARANMSVGSLHNIAVAELPPPRMRIGRAGLYAAEDIRFWLRSRIDKRKLTLAEGRITGRKKRKVRRG